MGENKDNEMTENGGIELDLGCDGMEVLEPQPVPLRCCFSEIDGGIEVNLEHEMINNLGRKIILVPWYPSQVDGVANFSTDYYGTKVCGTESVVSPWDESPTNESGTSNSSLAEASTSGCPRANLVSQFVGMGFPEKIVRKTLEENGEDNTDLLLEILLTHMALDNDSSEAEKIPSDLNDLSLSDNSPKDEENIPSTHQLDKERNFLHLIGMGFPTDEALSAIYASGPETSMVELVDFICASQASRLFNAPLQEEPARQILDDDETVAIKKRKLGEGRAIWKRHVDTSREKATRQKYRSVHDDVKITKNMIGFGVPNRPICHRKIPEAAIGPPYFYYENVAFTPKGVWSTISRFLFEIEPEFVDSLHFCAAARKRGYVHNLPIQNRSHLEPMPPLTIQEAFPMTKEWWPSWDDRTKLNCLGTNIASGKIAQELGDILEQWTDTPPVETQKYVLSECRNNNLIWIGKNKLASLEPDEMELILGYPKNHTRGGGISRTDRYKSLGNTFQVNTVAYHLSVLKSIFPNGMNVLSLFSGIGGAEVALHRLGIPLKNVVSVEISEVNRNIIRSWWHQTKQKGKLIELQDVKELSVDKLKHFIESLGGFDLVIGGSPCNNLSGNNRVSRDGLQGEHSVLFYDYFRILKDVKVIMGSSYR